MSQVLKFKSEHCNPCKVLEKELDSIGVKTRSIDIETDEGMNLCEKYKVKCVPTLIKINESGDEVNRLNGLNSSNKLQLFFND
jgi:hypothetical protein